MSGGFIPAGAAAGRVVDSLARDVGSRRTLFVFPEGFPAKAENLALAKRGDSKGAWSWAWAQALNRERPRFWRLGDAGVSRLTRAEDFGIVVARYLDRDLHRLVIYTLRDATSRATRLYGQPWPWEGAPSAVLKVEPALWEDVETAFDEQRGSARPLNGALS